jgi:hypothetical protein
MANIAHPYVDEMVEDWDAILVTEDANERQTPKDGIKFSLQEIDALAGPKPVWAKFKKLNKVWRVYFSAEEENLNLLIIQSGKYHD